MPLRELSREQAWMLPPSLDEMLSKSDPARLVAMFVDSLTADEWAAFGVNIRGEARGAPAYHPRALLGVWIYGFMSGVRSSRKLEAVVRRDVGFLWLTGRQRPDHNTLWRFYKQHRLELRGLLRRTVRLAVDLDMVDWAVQAVDGTKVEANASDTRTYNAEGLVRLMTRTEQAISDLEAQNEGDGPGPAELPPELREKRALRERILAAKQQIDEGETRHANLTDPDARLMRVAGGDFITGWNAQTMAVRMDGGGMLITAAEVTQEPADTQQLLPLMDASEAAAGRTPDLTLADAGYFSGANLTACAERGAPVAIPEPRSHTAHPYHQDRFVYDPVADNYRCPQGEMLAFHGVKRRQGRPTVLVYRANGAACRACPAFGRCTKSRRGRRLEVSVHAAALRSHRRWMATPEAREAYRRRKGLVEPVFGVIKEQLNGRRFLLRGSAGVRSEWSLLAAAFNLRTLWRAWMERPGGRSKWSSLAPALNLRTLWRTWTRCSSASAPFRRAHPAPAPA